MLLFYVFLVSVSISDSIFLFSFELDVLVEDDWNDLELVLDLVIGAPSVLCFLLILFVFSWLFLGSKFIPKTAVCYDMHGFTMEPGNNTISARKWCDVAAV